MNTLNFQTQLDQIEDKIGAFSQALMARDAQQLQPAAAALHAAALEFSNLLKQQPSGLRYSSAVQLRIKGVAALLASRREILIRQSAGVAQALAALVPSSQSDTYAPLSAGGSRQPYGALARKSGEFKAFAA